MNTDCTEPHIEYQLRLCLVALIGYESLAVLKARQKTPAMFDRLLSKENATLSLSDVSRDRIHQLLLIEDPGFYHHRGFDFFTPGAGLTTVTQGLVKYLYFDRFTPGFMKIEQTLIAWLAVDSLVRKDDQLTVFINTAYLGTCEKAEVRGFSAAAMMYFGKPFSKLTDYEYLSLVAMLIGPDEFSVKYQSARNRGRVERIRKVLSGEYKPRGLRDVYYGQNY